MGMKGKGRRRREANVNASHPEVASLAPPPVMKDVSAVPSKLRRIMKFKESSIPGVGGQVKTADGAGQDKKPGKISRKPKDGKQEPSESIELGKKTLAFRSSVKQSSVEGGDLAEEQPKPTSKRKREQEELEKFSEQIKAKPVHTGIRERRKTYLVNKKKKKLKSSTYEAMLAEPEHEKIAFGDIVQAPPKLSYPAKAKITMKEERPASHERVRLQAIEAYRQRRAGNITRLGQGPPPSTLETVPTLR